MAKEAVVETTEVIEEVTDNVYELYPELSNNDPVEEESEGSFGKIIIGGALLAGGAAAFMLRNKIKDKITQRRIEKLEKTGYTVLDNNDIDDDFDDDFFDEEETVEQEKKESNKKK